MTNCPSLVFNGDRSENMSDSELVNGQESVPEEALEIPLSDVKLGEEGGFLQHLKDAGLEERQLQEECQIPEEERLKILAKRREDQKDNQTEQGIKIGKKIATANEMDTIFLTEEEAQALGIDYQERGCSRTELFDQIQSRIANLSDGRESVFRVYEQGTAETGRIIRERVEQLMVAQGAMVELGRLAVEKGDLESAISILGARSGIKLADVPSWGLKPLEKAVCEVSLQEGDNLARIAALADSLRKQLTKKEIERAVTAEEIDGLTPVLRMYRAAHDANKELQLIRQRERAEKRRQLHSERMRTVEADTYEMTEELGREWVRAWLESPNKAVYPKDYYLRHSEREQYMNVRLKTLFEKCPPFHDVAIKAMGKDRLSDPEVFLRVISAINQDSEVFQSAAAILADYEAENGLDWGDYRLKDYGDHRDLWNEYWEKVLKWQLNGLALGIVQEIAVTPFSEELEQRFTQQIWPSEKWNEKRFNDKRTAIAATAMEALWGDKAAQIYDESTQSTFSRDKKIALRRFSQWINAFEPQSDSWQLVERAVVKVGENVKEKKRRVRQEAEREASRIEKLEIRFKHDSRPLEQKLTKLEEAGEEKYPEDLARLKALGRLQAQLTPADKLVEIVGTGQEERLGLKKSYRKAFEQKRTRLEKERAELEPEKSKADKRERYFDVHRQLAEVRTQLRFIDEVGKELKEYNRERAYRKPGRLAKKKTMWRHSFNKYLPSYGEMTPAKLGGLQEVMTEFFGETGLLSIQQQEYKALCQAFAEAEDFEAKDEVCKQMVVLERESTRQLEEARKGVDEAFERDGDNALNYTVVKWVLESLEPWLRGQKRLF